MSLKKRKKVQILVGGVWIDQVTLMDEPKNAARDFVREWNERHRAHPSKIARAVHRNAANQQPLSSEDRKRYFGAQPASEYFG